MLIFCLDIVKRFSLHILWLIVISKIVFEETVKYNLYFQTRQLCIFTKKEATHSTSLHVDKNTKNTKIFFSSWIYHLLYEKVSNNKITRAHLSFIHKLSFCNANAPFQSWQWSSGQNCLSFFNRPKDNVTNVQMLIFL